MIIIRGWLGKVQLLPCPIEVSLNIKTIETLDPVALGNQAVAFSVLGDNHEHCQLIQLRQVKYDYHQRSKKNKGIANKLPDFFA